MFEIRITDSEGAVVWIVEAKEVHVEGNEGRTAVFTSNEDAELFVRAKERGRSNDCGQTTSLAGRELLAAESAPVYDFGNTAEVREFDHLYGGAESAGGNPLPPDCEGVVILGETGFTIMRNKPDDEVKPDVVIEGK